MQVDRLQDVLEAQRDQAEASALEASSVTLQLQEAQVRKNAVWVFGGGVLS